MLENKVLLLLLLSLLMKEHSGTVIIQFESKILTTMKEQHMC